MHELVIHIGMGKSASTTIQKNVLSHPDAPVNICRHNEKELKRKKLTQLWWRGLLSPLSPNAKKAKEILINKYINQHQLVVLSDESISTSPLLVDNLIKNIKDLDVKIKILFITRNQLTFLPSLFNHSMRSKIFALGVPRLNTYMLNRLEYKEDINTWIKDLIDGHNLGDPNIIENLCYHKIIKKLYNTVGSDSSMIIPVELLSTNQYKFSKCLSNAFGMNPNSILERMNKRENVTGSRLRDYKLGKIIIKTFTNPTFKLIWDSFKINPEKTSKLLSTFLSNFFKPDIKKIDEQSKFIINKKFSLSNKKYAEMTGWNLEKLNYPIPNEDNITYENFDFEKNI